MMKILIKYNTNSYNMFNPVIPSFEFLLKYLIQYMSLVHKQCDIGITVKRLNITIYLILGERLLYEMLQFRRFLELF